VDVSMKYFKWVRLKSPVIRGCLGVLIVVIVSVAVQHFLFNTAFTESMVPAVAAAGGYLIVLVALGRYRKERVR
jgi:hypothetical protein